MHDAPLEAHEHTEHLTHGHNDAFVSRVAVLIAVLAVCTAVAGNLESLESEGALVATGEATLNQDEATDAWSEYQADSLKRHLYTLAAEAHPDKAGKYEKTAREENDKQAAVRARAEAAQAERSRLLAESRHHETRHHWLSGAATLFEIAIALTTVSLVTRRDWLWQGAAVLGCGALVLLAAAYL